MPEYDAKFVQCPFYVENFSKKQASEHRIRCEGVERNNKINLVFGNQENKHRYMVRFCFDIVACQKCRINKMLTEMYREG